MGYLQFGEEDCFAEYLRYRSYTLRTFPNPDPSIGEWIQIRTRAGAPLAESVGGRLPVKDPYHLMRTLMLLTDLIGQSMP